LAARIEISSSAFYTSLLLYSPHYYYASEIHKFQIEVAGEAEEDVSTLERERHRVM